jgi:hypothetical protein
MLGLVPLAQEEKAIRDTRSVREAKRAAGSVARKVAFGKHVIAKQHLAARMAESHFQYGQHWIEDDKARIMRKNQVYFVRERPDRRPIGSRHLVYSKWRQVERLPHLRVNDAHVGAWINHGADVLERPNSLTGSRHRYPAWTSRREV